MTDRPPGRALRVVTDGPLHDLTPPHDLDAERAILGACLIDREAIEQAFDLITPADFYDRRHERIYAAIERRYSRLEPVDQLAIVDDLRKDLPQLGGQTYVFELVMAPGALTGATHSHATTIARLAAKRRLLTAHLAGIQHALRPDDADTPIQDLLDASRAALDQIPTGVPGAEAEDIIPGEPIDQFLAGDDPEYDWLIPGLLERQDRLILTAGEGHGKSTLLRQLAIQTAAGLHPFNGDTTAPVKVLIVDLENSRRQTRRKLRALRTQAGPGLRSENLVIECKVDGLDLTQPHDQAWLERMLKHHRPDLLITGPIYKLANGDPSDEKDAKPVAMALDRMRATHGVAIILEAHSKKGDGGKHRPRPREPFGWSGWMRWPEFGLHLSEDGELTHWRGMRDERAFPHQLNRGGLWPFTPVTTIHEQHWATIRATIRAAGRKLTYQELEEATGIRSRKVLHSVMSDHSGDLARLYYELQIQDDQ